MTFTRYAPGQKIAKTNYLNFVGVSNSKGINRIAKLKGLNRIADIYVFIGADKIN
jgi:hypothetical protein